MTKVFIPQMKPWFGEEEKKAVCEYMDEGGFLTEYKHTTQFEQSIAEYTGAKHCIVVNNGTISLTLAAIALGIKAGDEVIVPNYTMIATPNSVKMIGATPVFVDVEEETLCLNVELVRKAITPNTKALILVSANGRYPKTGIAAFEELSGIYNIPLIEDAAQSLGSYYPDGRHIGQAGKVGSFSFSSPKIISTGQGGALITDDDEVAFKLRRLKDFGRASGGNDIHDSIGYNFKFTELQACVGIEQMKKLPQRVERKKEIWKRYSDNLHSNDSITFFDHNLEATVPWFIDSKVKRRDELVSFLYEENIGTRKMYPPINAQAAYKIPGKYPESEKLGEMGLWLPSMTQLENQDIDYISDKILDFYKRR